MFWRKEEFYRFGFNGKEMDNETSGTGNMYDYGFRIYNPRIAKFLSVDPLFKSYPWYTPYQFAGNSPIYYIDLEGLERASANDIKLAKRMAELYLELPSSSKIFPDISRKEVGKQILDRLIAIEDSQNPDKTNIVAWYYCGPTAVSHVFLEYDPVEYVNAIMSLYEFGEYNDLKVADKTKKILIINGTADDQGEAEFVDFLLIETLRSNENGILSSEDINRSFKHQDQRTYPWEMPDMGKAVGLKTTFFTTNFSMSPVGPYLNVVKKELDKGRYVVLLDDGKVYSGVKQNRVGIHYYTVHSIKIEGKNITMKIWEHGKYTEVNTTKKEFRKHIKAIMSFKEKKGG